LSLPDFAPDQTGGSNEPVPGASLEIAGGEGWFDRVTADDGGEYRFDAPPGPVVVTVRSDTCGDQRIHDLVIRRDEEIRHDVLLHRGCRVELIVMSSAGATAGAATRVMVTALDERVESVSGEDGHAIHDGLTPGPGKYAVVASGFREVAVDILIPASRTLVRKPIFLERAPTWSLEVVDPEGKAMPEAFVIIRRDRDPIVSARAKEKEKLQVLDPTRTYSIEVSAEGFARVRKSLEIDADGSTTLGVQLMRGGRISGRMLDFRQQPVPGAQVLISSRNLPPGDKPVARLTTTARDGSFRTTRFAPGSYRVQMSTPRLGRVSVDIVIRDGEDSILGNIVLKPPGGG
ncbi:MAG TPA: carboxypeptidase regulatory-like domain-containing protein, partial [Planctomycetes bacterium]|nr:carboxypeptidase regulatory-like domain-containing protein [Planctomycetota bacterium]